MITFPIPAGFEVPDGAENSTFDAVATLSVRDGQLYLEALDGVPIEHEGKKGSSPKKGFLESVEDRMAAEEQPS